MDVGANGADVVSQVIDRFNCSGWETDETVLRFLKRTALVESDFGQDADTFRDGYYGGIWQVDEDAFDDTQNTSVHTELLPAITEIFGINWVNDVTWMDLLKPLYSGIAARLYLSIQPTPIPIPETSNITGQAAYWKTHYNRNDSETAQHFIDRVNSTEGSYEERVM